jgi:signal transduction histidine kinase
MTRPSLRKISTKVALSFMLIVLLQGGLCIIVLSFTMREAMRASLDDQQSKTRTLIESYMSDARKEMGIKASLVAGQANLVNLLARGDLATLRYELRFFLAPLKLDALLIVDGKGRRIVEVGDASLGSELLKGNPIALLEQGKSFYTTSTGASSVKVKTEGNRIQLWSFNEMSVGKRRLVLCAAQSLDHSFIGRLEDVSGARMLLALHNVVQVKDKVEDNVIILVNGRVEDNVFIEYSRRVAADARSGDHGTVKSLVYNTTSLAEFPGLELIYFIDTDPRHNALANALDRTLALTLAIIAATLLIAAVTSLFLYRYSFKKPFAAFQDAIRRISNGDLSFQFSPGTEDEFAGLEREFEGMTENLRKLERELQISSRMAAVGEMVAGVAHQIRNPLAVMKVSAGMIRDAAEYQAARMTAPARRGEARRPEAGPRPPDADIRPLANMIVSEVDSLNATISKFLDFTRPLSVKLQEVEMGEFLSRAAAHIPMERFPGREVRVDVAEGAERASFDRNLMEQAVSNLVANALAASRPGQEVLLRAERDGGEFRIIVKDEGEGMSDEVRSQLFHPFFTTKSDGTGLGLSIVHRIVEEHGGTIDVRTGPGGTSFEIRLGGAA